jgi:hypothetical protein
LAKQLRVKALVQSGDNCSPIFDFVTTDRPVLFKNLISSWEDEIEESPAPWLSDMATQILRILERRPGAPSRAPIVACSDRRRRQILVTHAAKDDASAHYELQVLFIDFSDPKSIFMEDVMIPIDQISYKILHGAEEKQMYLLELLKDLEDNQQSKAVLLWKDRTPAYIVEPDDIYKFIVNSGPAVNQDASKLSMDDLLKDKKADTKLRNSFAVASPKTSLAQARKAMEEVDTECRCVFVTVDGKLGNQALGLFTDHTARSA